MLFSHLIRPTTLFLLTGALVFAQSPAADQSARSERQKKNQQLRETRALALLGELLAEVPSLRLPENRVRLRLAAAELLWKRDEKRARALYREATSGLAEILSATRLSDDESEEGGQPVYALWEQLRFMILEQVALHDPKLAEELLAASRPPAGVDENTPDNLRARESEFEMRLAARLADSDPQRAYQLAEEKLAGGPKGAAGEVMEFLQRLMGSDPKLASKLAGSILGRLRADYSGSESEPPYLLSRLITIISAQPTGDTGAGAGKDDKKNPPRVDEAVLREAIELMVTRTLALLADTSPVNYQRNQYAMFGLMELQRLMPLVEKYAPGRVAALRAKLAELDKSMTPEQKSARELQALMERGDTEAILVAAAKLPKEMSQGLYYQVAVGAMTAGDLEKARQIAEKHLQNSPLRKQVENQLDQAALQKALEKGRVDEVRPMLDRLHSIQERVGILTQLAEAEFGKGNRKGAQQLLEEAHSLVGSRAANRAQLEAQIALATGYAEVDPARSFEILDSAAGRINELIAAAAALEGFNSPASFREGEMVMLDEDGNSLSDLLRQHAAALAPLVATDFERVKSVVAQFQRGEVKAFLRMAMIESTLGEHVEDDNQPPPPPPAGRGIRRLIEVQKSRP
ncbi:MAG TPA: hypothetical protein VFD58_24240 [Blastocatellia bacterium]|nr:hypothetical protein [Blastocatellia bacterium]